MDLITEFLNKAKCDHPACNEKSTHFIALEIHLWTDKTIPPSYVVLSITACELHSKQVTLKNIPLVKILANATLRFLEFGQLVDYEKTRLITCKPGDEFFAKIKDYIRIPAGNRVESDESIGQLH